MRGRAVAPRRRSRRSHNGDQGYMTFRVIAFIGPSFWDLVLLLPLSVFVHEGGAFSRRARLRRARARVLPRHALQIQPASRLQAHRDQIWRDAHPVGRLRRDLRHGPTDVACAPRVLSSIHRSGVARVSDLAAELNVSQSEIEDACSLLYGWGSIVPWDVESAQGEEGPQAPVASG